MRLSVFEPDAWKFMGIESPKDANIRNDDANIRNDDAGNIRNDDAGNNYINVNGGSKVKEQAKLSTYPFLSNFCQVSTGELDAHKYCSAGEEAPPDPEWEGSLF